ncbi:hypothetical protein BH09GEM1_BH09GEM1_35700 [soil metagenome]
MSVSLDRDDQRGSRWKLVLAVILYITAYNATYRDVITPVFSFWGMGYRDIAPQYFWTTVMLCVIPSLWMPVTFSRPTLLMFYIQYFIVYIPAAFLVFHSTKPELPHDFAMKIVWSMFLGISAIQLSYRVPTARAPSLRMTPGAFWAIFTAVAIVMLAYLLVTLSGNFHLVSFGEVNSVRYAMGDIVAATGTRFGAYAQFLLLALFLPVFFAVGAYTRRWWLVGVTGAVYIFIFGISGAKQAALSLVYLPAINALLTRRTGNIPVLFIGGLGGLLLTGYASKAFLGPLPNVAYLSIIHFRFLTIPAFTIPEYAGFFAAHPVTHLSHVTGINLLIQYPYESDVAYTIGRFYFHTFVGLNGGIWSTDGIGGFGIWGIPMLSLLCAAIFWLFDSIAADMDQAFVGVVLSYGAVSFLNVSIFTTLITGGLASVMMVLLVAPRDGSGRIELPTLPYPVFPTMPVR